MKKEVIIKNTTTQSQTWYKSKCYCMFCGIKSLWLKNGSDGYLVCTVCEEGYHFAESKHKLDDEEDKQLLKQLKDDE